MYGWINASLESLIISKWGIDTWREIQKKSGYLYGFNRSIDYDDKSTINILKIASKLLNVEVPQLIEDLGAHFLHFMRTNSYESTVRIQGSDFHSWLENINEPHRLIHSRYPLSNPPKFWVEAREANSSSRILHYYTKRNSAFSPLVIGIVKEAARYFFHLQVELVKKFDEFLPSNVYHCVWCVNIIGDIDPSDKNAISDYAYYAKEPYVVKEFDYFNECLKEKPVPSGNYPTCPFAKGFLANHPSSITSDDQTKDSETVELNDDISNSLSVDSTKSPFHEKALTTSTSSSFASSPSSPSNRCPHLKSGKGITFSPSMIKKLFPYHFVVDDQMKIIQIGNSMEKLVRRFSIKESDSDKVIGLDIKNMFNIVSPFAPTFNWSSLFLLVDSDLEIEYSHAVYEDRPITFKGSVSIIDKNTGHEISLSDVSNVNKSDQLLKSSSHAMDSSSSAHFFIDQNVDFDFSKVDICVFFLISLDVKHVNELDFLKLKISDFPRYGFHRDNILMKEHLRTETDLSINLHNLSNKLFDARAKLLSSLRMKSIFVRYVSHEIRNPLNSALVGLKKIIEETKPENENQFEEGALILASKSSGDLLDVRREKKYDLIHDLADSIENSCYIAIDILNDLLLYEKLEGGFFNLQFIRISVMDYIQDINNSYRIHAQTNDIEFSVTCDNNLKNVYFYIDTQKLSQVLRNLITNALKFTPPQGTIAVNCTLIPYDYEDPYEIIYAPIDPAASMNMECGISQNQDVKTIRCHSVTIEQEGIDPTIVSYASDQYKPTPIIVPLKEDTGQIDYPIHKDDLLHQIKNTSHEINKFVDFTSNISKHYISTVAPTISPSSDDYSLRFTPQKNSAKNFSEIKRNQEYKAAIKGEDSNSENFQDDISSKSLNSPSTPIVAVQSPTSTNTTPIIEASSSSTPMSEKPYYCRFSVTDSGKGITYEDQKKLFNEFYQVSTDGFQGIGLGLWISRVISQLHGGRIGLYSSGLGEGTTFVVDIPVLTEDINLDKIFEESDGQKKTIKNSTPKSSSNSYLSKEMKYILSSKRALIVDDVHLNQKVLSQSLADIFKEIALASDGSDAINLYLERLKELPADEELKDETQISELSTPRFSRTNSSFHIVFIDWHMKKVHGPETARKIRSIDPDVILFGLTGDEYRLQEFLDAGLDYIFLKPLDLNNFYRVITSLKERIAKLENSK